MWSHTNAIQLEVSVSNNCTWAGELLQLGRFLNRPLLGQPLNNGSNIIKPWALAHGFMILEPLFKQFTNKIDSRHPERFLLRFFLEPIPNDPKNGEEERWEFVEVTFWVRHWDSTGYCLVLKHRFLVKSRSRLRLGTVFDVKIHTGGDALTSAVPSPNARRCLHFYRHRNPGKDAESDIQREVPFQRFPTSLGVPSNWMWHQKKKGGPFFGIFFLFLALSFSASLLFCFFAAPLLSCFSASLLLLCFLVFLLSCSCSFVMPCFFVVSSVLAALACVLCEW